MPVEKRPPGRIVSISSQAAHVALPGHAAYCASKAGLLGLVRSQALEWGGEGLTSNSVSVGPCSLLLFPPDAGSGSGSGVVEMLMCFD